MPTEQNKLLTRRLIEEAWSKGNLAVIDETITPTFVYRTTGLPEFRGPDGFKTFVIQHRQAFPDIHYTIEDLVAEGDKVVARWTASGTHQGDMMGIAPTGKRATLPGISIFRLSGGTFEEGLTNWDALGMLQQLGVIPAPGQASV